MNSMTDEDAEYWDGYYTNNTIFPDLTKPGFFARNYGMMIKLDPETIRLLTGHAEAVHKSSAQVTGELVREKTAV